MDNGTASAELEAQAKAEGLDVLRLSATDKDKAETILSKLPEEDKAETYVIENLETETLELVKEKFTPKAPIPTPAEAIEQEVDKFLNSTSIREELITNIRQKLYGKRHQG